MRVIITGQKSFGAAVFRSLRERDDIDVSAVVAPGPGDLLWDAADQAGVSTTLSASLCPATVEGVDLLIAAHSHAFVGRKTRSRLRIGAVGYHPSLLPRHRGRDAVEWTIRMKDPIAGGSVYWLSDKVDGGHIAAREMCFVRPDDTASELWRRDLFPMGVRLINCVISDLLRGIIVQEPQIEEVATWEPPTGGRPRLFRPELEMIGAMPEGMRVVRSVNGSTRD